MRGQYFNKQTPESIKARFWEKVDKTVGHGSNNDCWIWTSTIVGGYGQFKLNCKGIVAHRFSYEITYGTIPKDLIVCHRCDNPLCVNPAHLWVGTNADNSFDMKNKGRSLKGDKNNARLYPEKLKRGSQHPSSVLNENQVLEIRYKWNKAHKKFGMFSELAKEYGVNRTTISAIIKYKRWKHI